MERKPVSSSNIESVGYDESSREMHIEFKGGKLYSYQGVSPEQHRALVDAPSVGSHFHKHIRPHFPGTKL